MRLWEAARVQSVMLRSSSTSVAVLDRPMLVSGVKQGCPLSRGRLYLGCSLVLLRVG